MAEITLREYIDKMKLKVRKLSETDAPLLLAASSALAQFSTRVFVQGQTIDGGQYQYNDTTPLYVYPDKTFGNTSRLRPPRGKPTKDGKKGRTKFESTGKSHKTTYVRSYKELRSIVGREASFKNFVAHGDLKSEIENRASGNVSPRKVGDGYQVSVNSEENSGKLKGLMVKSPGVFQFSSSEKNTFFNVFEKEILRIIQS